MTRIALLFLAVLLAYALGCGPRAGARGIVLELWIVDWNEDTRRLLNERVLPVFEKRYPGVRVNVQYLDWGHLDEKLTISFAGGVSPDVFQVGAEYVGGIAYRGQARVLDDYVRAWGQRDDFYDASWNTCVYNGHVYGIPYLSAPRALVYRKDLLRQAGYNAPPRTWEELVEAAQKMTLRRGGNYERAGFYLPVSFQIFVEFLWENGGDIVTPDGKRAVLDSPEAIEALQFYCDLYTKHQVCPTSGLPTVGGEVPFFAAGKSAMEINNQFAVKRVKQYAPRLLDQVGVAVPAWKKRPVVTVYTDWLALSPQSRHPDAAWKLIAFLMEPENLAAYNETQFFLPPRKSLKNAKFLRENPLLRVYLDLMEKHGRALPPIRQWFRIRDGLKGAVEEAIYGLKTPEQALQDYNRTLNALLREED